MRGGGSCHNIRSRPREIPRRSRHPLGVFCFFVFRDNKEGSRATRSAAVCLKLIGGDGEDEDAGDRRVTEYYSSTCNCKKYHGSTDCTLKSSTVNRTILFFVFQELYAVHHVKYLKLEKNDVQIDITRIYHPAFFYSYNHLCSRCIDKKCRDSNGDMIDPSYIGLKTHFILCREYDRMDGECDLTRRAGKAKGDVRVPWRSVASEAWVVAL